MSRWSLCLPVLVLGLVACGSSGSSAGSAPATVVPTSASASVPSVTTSGSPSGSTGGKGTPTSAATTEKSEAELAGTPTGGGGTVEFVRVVRSRVPEVAAGRTTAEIAAIATTACRSLRAGRAADAVQAEARSLGTLDAEATDDATARELVKLAIDTTCLDQASRVDEF